MAPPSEEKSLTERGLRGCSDKTAYSCGIMTGNVMLMFQVFVISKRREI